MYKTVFDIESGDRASRHNNPGAHMFTKSSQDRLFDSTGVKGTIGDAFVGEDGNTYYTAQYNTPQEGRKASEFFIDEILSKTNNDLELFYSMYSGKSPNDSIVKEVAKRIKDAS